MKRILFVSHEASRTGAPIILLNICKWIHLNTTIDFDVLFLKPGDLYSDFEKISKSYLYNKKPTNKLDRLQRRLFRGRLQKRILNKIFKNKHDIIYVNTIAAIRVLDQLSSRSDSKVILHLHELSTIMCQMGKGLAENIQYVDLIIAASESVKNDFLNEYPMVSDRLEVIYEPIVLNELEEELNYEKVDLKAQLHLPKDAFIVGGCGTRGWRKGVDIFLQTASLLKQQNYFFVWLGGKNEGLEYLRLSTDIKKMGLVNNIFFMSSAPHPISYFKNFDVFFLSSREDPFPLVCLENAACGNPIICFDGGGGMPEFVANDAGTRVPYLDINEAANVIEKYGKDSAMRNRHGQKAQEKVKLYDINCFIKCLNNTIQKRFDLSLIVSNC